MLQLMNSGLNRYVGDIGTRLQVAGFGFAQMQMGKISTASSKYG